jgi:hypothetical protein
MKEYSEPQDTWHYHTAEHEQPLPFDLFLLSFILYSPAVLALMLTCHDKLNLKKLMILHQLYKAPI